MYIPWDSTLRVTAFGIGHRPEQSLVASELGNVYRSVRLSRGRMRGSVTVEVTRNMLAWLTAVSDADNWTAIPHNLTPTATVAFTVAAPDTTGAGDYTITTPTTRSEVDKIGAGMVYRVENSGPYAIMTRTPTAALSVGLAPIPAPAFTVATRLDPASAIAAHVELPPSAQAELSHTPDWADAVTLVWVEAIGSAI